MSEFNFDYLNLQEEEIISDMQANYQLGQIAKIEAERDSLIDFHKKKIEEIKAEAEYRKGFKLRALRAFFDTVPHRKTKTQENYPLPNGKLVWKKQNPEYVKDEKAVIDWLKTQEGGKDFVKTEEKLAWDDLKKAAIGSVDGKLVFKEEVNEDGEIIQTFIPGIEVVERGNIFDVAGVKCDAE